MKKAVEKVLEVREELKKLEKLETDADIKKVLKNMQCSIRYVLLVLEGSIV